MLTATQEDYLEAVCRLAQSGADVQISALANRLNCRLPTVTRTVQKLAELGFVQHESRGKVQLTRVGRATAEHLVHRHDDLVRFLAMVLGMSAAEAEVDACQLEHGMSALAAQRLHRWLKHLSGLTPENRRRVMDFSGRDDPAVPDFYRLPAGRTVGWRG
jgi:DtxR family Mn-dependent transcriptional regulator